MKGVQFSMELIRKGYLLHQKWYIIGHPLGYLIKASLIRGMLPSLSNSNSVYNKHFTLPLLYPVDDVSFKIKTNQLSPFSYARLGGN